MYTWKATLDSNLVYRVPGGIRDELCISVLFLSLSDVSIRSDPEPTLRCTDATPGRFGACSSPCPPSVTAALYRVFRHRGEHTRLDWGEEGAPALPSIMVKADLDTNGLFA